MHRRLFLVLPFTVALGAGASTALDAGDLSFTSVSTKAALVELYTSEGCSSCPPAEAWLNDLTKDPRLWKELFPVAFHVDYWDGLGWPDRFSRPDYTQRQQAIAARLGQDSVYTPEFVVDGAEFRGWFHGQPLPAAHPKSGALTLKIQGESISASYEADGPHASGPLTFNVALLGMHLVTDVKRGENGGRQLEHDFIVLGFHSEPLATGSGASMAAGPTALRTSTGDAPAAVVGWVSAGDGSILQVAGGWTAARTE